MQKKYHGVVVPMATPLTKELKIDTEAVRKIMAVFAENNLSPLILGTTGESTSIGKAESAVFVEAAVKAKQSNQVIYAGLVGNDVAGLIERAKLYAGLGADVVVSTLPSYYILTPPQMEKFYMQLADASACPVMMYNIKATTQMSIPLETAETLSRHPNIVGLKDSERDMERLETAINTYRNRSDFSFFCGWGAQGLQSLRMGADGIVPSTGNAVPEMYKALYDAFLQKEYALAEKIQKATDEVAAIYQQGRTLGQSLAALKILMERRGFCQRCMMPPLAELQPEEVAEIQTYKF
ncbi:MAG: dihydrodipicolinate synthase family protein [Dysgonamonadaceae bacterium]|jgi:4-hydroxy-tetrahydrodipicolinate synthase|nr:dihydrodipicolinate synthase family protein [Dysgonamonadaceae bacterium]